jgi:flagellar hook-associated protein 1 FlgK
MADLLSIGASAANTFKNAIDVTSHNVANVSTEGYSRQRAEISSNATNSLTTAFNGGGSSVDTIERIYASYIQTQLVNSNSLKSRYDEQLSLAQQVEGVIASNDEGVQDFMQRIFDSFQELADNPTSSTTQQVVLDESVNMESLLGNMTNVLNETSEQVNKQLSNTVNEVNTRLEAIHKINEQVANLINTNAQPPNDLLDQRDQAILELSQYMDIKTYPQDDGKINVSTGDGRLPLISDRTLTKLDAGLSEYTHDNRFEVYMNINGERRVISDNINGGELGAVLDFRENMLDKSMNELGVVLNGMAASINWQHYQGYDEDGNAGGNLYAPLDANALASSKNTGTEDGTNILVNFTPDIAALPGYNGQPPYNPGTQPATYGDKEAFLDTAFTAIGEFKAREYEVRVNGAGDFDVYDASDVGSGPLATVPFGTNTEIDGLNFDFSGVGAGTVTEGDKFIVKPHQAMLENFETVLTDAGQLATRGQSPIDTGAAGLDDEVPAPAAEGDNTNMANMASLQNKNLLYSDVTGTPSETLLGGYSMMATNVGTYVSSTEIQATAQSNVYDQMVSRRESLSGVNLDEEAANLLRFQQAYQASAQILQTAQSIFQTLMNAIG